MVALLTATVGVSVQQIYCYCLGKTTVALFVAEDACASDDQAESPACCTKPVPRPTAPCYQKNGHNGLKNHDGCMEKSTKVFQMKTEFVVDKPFEKPLDGPFWMPEMPMFRHFFRSAVCEAKILNKAPPPPLSGRDICLRHQLFRC